LKLLHQFFFLLFFFCASHPQRRFSSTMLFSYSCGCENFFFRGCEIKESENKEWNYYGNMIKREWSRAKKYLKNLYSTEFYAKCNLLMLMLIEYKNTHSLNIEASCRYFYTLFIAPLPPLALSVWWIDWWIVYIKSFFLFLRRN
jgi:hypothetical protein